LLSPKTHDSCFINAHCAAGALAGGSSTASARQWGPRPQQRLTVRATAAHPSGAKVRHGAVVAKRDARFGVVVGRFNDLVTKLLLEGALGAFESHGATMENIEVGEGA
jgi:hypothetical protein